MKTYSKLECDYRDLSKLTGYTVKNLRKKYERGEFDPHSLISIAHFLMAEYHKKEARIKSTVAG